MSDQGTRYCSEIPNREHLYNCVVSNTDNSDIFITTPNEQTRTMTNTSSKSESVIECVKVN